jgi:hypothetical protein
MTRSKSLTLTPFMLHSLFKIKYLGCDNLLPGRWLPMFRRNLLPPSSLVTFSPTMNMEPADSSEILVTLYQVWCYHIPVLLYCLVQLRCGTAGSKLRKNVSIIDHTFTANILREVEVCL